jgi:hypothetical protein
VKLALLLLAPLGVAILCCGNDSPDPGKCYAEMPGGLVEVACPPEDLPSAVPAATAPPPGGR